MENILKMSTRIIEIDNDTLDFIMDQLEKNILVLKHRHSSEQLKILMPNWLKGILYSYYRQKVSIRDFNYLFGIKIGSHYKNEIVVFNENYSFDSVNHHLIITIQPPRPFPPEFRPPNNL